MKNVDLWVQYQGYTKDVTANARRLAFAAAAICWFFKTESAIFPRPILWSLGSVVAFFVVDLFQFMLGAILMGGWTRIQESARWRETGSIEGDYHKPGWLDGPVFALWCVKIVLLLVAFAFIGWHLLHAQTSLP